MTFLDSGHTSTLFSNLITSLQPLTIMPLRCCSNDMKPKKMYAFKFLIYVLLLVICLLNESSNCCDAISGDLTVDFPKMRSGINKTHHVSTDATVLSIKIFPAKSILFETQFSGENIGIPPSGKSNVLFRSAGE